MTVYEKLLEKNDSFTLYAPDDDLDKAYREGFTLKKGNNHKSITYYGITVKALERNWVWMLILAGEVQG